MKHPRMRLFGVLIAVLGIAALGCGIFGGIADQAGTPLHTLYLNSLRETEAFSAAQAALASAQEALPRAVSRANAAIEESNACITASQAALETEQSGAYDPETELGQLGGAIQSARESGADLSDVLDSYSTVYNAGLAQTLSEALATVKKAESTLTATAQTLQALTDAVRAIDPSAAFSEIPAFAETETTPLGESKGAQRLLTRAQNYLLRSEAAKAAAVELTAAGEAILSEAAASLNSHSVSATARFAQFASQRNLDMTCIGALLLLIALALLAFPAWLGRSWKNGLFRRGTIFTFAVLLLGLALHYADGELWLLMRQGVLDTLYMTIPATILAYLLGLPLGVLLVVTSPGHIRANPTLNNVVGTIVNFLRSIPFIILLVMLFDITRFVMGTAIGTRAIIFPLFVSAFPYVARIVEGSLNEVDRGVIEAAESMGSNTWQIITKVLLPEALPSLINGAAICLTTILAYTAMAGSAGGDGLGKIAITYGLNYRDYEVMYISSLLLVALVQIIQIAGGILTRAVDHRKK